MFEGTCKCPICGAPYKVYSMTVADQSACPACVREAERRALNPTQGEQMDYARRRAQHFNS